MVIRAALAVRASKLGWQPNAELGVIFPRQDFVRSRPLR